MLFFVCRWIHDRKEAEGGLMLWLQQEQLLVFTVKLEQQGTVTRRPTRRKQLAPSEAFKPRLDWMVNFISSSPARSRGEDGGGEGASSAGHKLSLVITATNNVPSPCTAGDDGFGASGRK